MTQVRPLVSVIDDDESVREALPDLLGVFGFVAETDQEAVDLTWPGYARMMSTVGRERGWRPPTKGEYEAALLAAKKIQAVLELTDTRGRPLAASVRPPWVTWRLLNR